MIQSETIRLPGGAALVSCVQNWRMAPDTRIRRGAVIVCPGGGYAMLSPTEGEAVVPAFAAEGYQSFLLRYRTGGDAVWPNPLIDLGQAVAYVRAHAHELMLDPDKIAICGFSAGAHLCAMLGTVWNRPETAAAAGCTAEQMRPNAMILCYPPTHLRIAGDGATLRLLAGGDEIGDLGERTDANRLVGTHTPPTFVWSMFDDADVPVELSLEFCRALTAAEVPFELHTFSHGLHACSLATAVTAFAGSENPHAAHWFPLCREWLLSLFGPPVWEGGHSMDHLFIGPRAHVAE